MSTAKKENLSQVAFESVSPESKSEKLDEVLHSKIPALEEFIANIREAETTFKSDYDRDGGHDRTYDRDSDHYDRGTFDRTH